jgi:hypothetical protein
MNRSHTRTSLRLVLKTVFVGVVFVGCGKSDTPATPSGGTPGEATKAEAPAPKLVTKTIGVPPKFDDPEIKVTLDFPESWVADDFFKGSWVPSAKADAMKVSVKFERTCNGQCSADEIPGNIVKAKKEATEAVTKPDLTLMGISAEDAPFWTGTVEVLGDETLPNGAALLAYRSSYPEAPADKARPISGLFVNCYVHNKDDDHYLIMEGRADAANEKHVWPVLKDVCATLTYATPAAAPEPAPAPAPAPE